jgi:hypothetical protein
VPYFAGASDDRRGESVGEEVGPGALTEQVNQLFGSCSVAACRSPHGLAQRGVDHVHLPQHAKVILCPSAQISVTGKV